MLQTAAEPGAWAGRAGGGGRDRQLRGWAVGTGSCRIRKVVRVVLGGMRWKGPGNRDRGRMFARAPSLRGRGGGGGGTPATLTTRRGQARRETS